MSPKARPILWMIGLQSLLFALLQTRAPAIRLDFFAFEFVYLLAWIPFIRVRQPWGSWYRPWLLSLIIPQFVFMLLHYQIHYAALSVVSLILWFVPLSIWGLVRFAIWNAKHVRDPKSWKALAPAVVSWGLYVFTYPPLAFGPAAVVLLAPWMIMLFTAKKDRALFATFWSAIVFHWIMYFWITNVAKVGPPVAIIGGVFLLMAYFSFFYVVGAWFFVRLRSIKFGKVPGLVLFPFLWAGIEVIRSLGQVSFPWGHLGYVLGNHVELVQALSGIGVYGYTILILFANMAMAHAIYNRQWKWAFAPALMLLVLWGHGSWRIQQESQIDTPSMRIALVQPSISQTSKWSKAYYDSVLTKTWSILDTMNTQGVDLIVLPETAVPDFISLRPKDEFKFKQFARKKNLDLLIGALNYDRNGPPPRKVHYYNSAFYFTKKGEMREYRKQRLVPFSEHLPFDGLVPAINYVDLGEGDFSPGTELPLLGSEQWTPNICYEIIYPDMARELVRAGTRLIVNITNDGWFGRTTAPGQHANLVRYRAIETGMPVARCANSGISVFYDHLGRDYARTRLYEVRSVEATLQVRSKTTLYSKIGDVWELLLAISAGLALLYFVAKNRAE